ncbi:MAG: hypothetical protein ACI376_09565 [Candidatus Bruticola sp.]
MANYPCAECGSMVETAGLGACKKCGSKKPFKCSKCGKQVGLDYVYKPDKLTFSGKPLYCLDCGADVEQVPCARCGKTLIRSTGVERPVDGVIKVYHKECIEQQSKIYKYVMPIIVIVGAITIGYAAYMILHSLGGAVLGALIGATLGKVGADKYLPN